MKTAINNNYHMGSAHRSDIFRKFQRPFRYLLRDSRHYNKDLYVEQASPRYREEFDAFTQSYANDVRYFIGYTGCGKSTFIRHYFDLDNTSPTIRNDTIIIPSFWNGKKISKDNYAEQINKHICSNIRSALLKIDNQKGLVFPHGELKEFHAYINATRGDILSTLTVEEYEQFGDDINQITARILTKTEKENPIEYASSSLKYFVEKHSSINRVIFIIDDVETMDADALNFLVETYYHMYDCFQNVEEKEIIINLLISLRPHSFRFLRHFGLVHEKIISYGNHLESRCYHIIRNDIPDIFEMFKKRFEKAEENIVPGNIDTWNKAKEQLFLLVGGIEKRYIDIITDICHMNIRAIFDCLQLILSNRIWCQESKPVSPYPDVKASEYSFNNIVNVLRTLSCGENSVYTGKMDMQFNASELEDMQQRPSFDGSEIFIPNVINNIDTRECDLTTVYVMYYLENKFSSTDNTPVNSEFITVKDLVSDIMNILNRDDEKYLGDVIQYLFENRIVRKSIKDQDQPDTINKLNPNTYIYLTRKGSRILKLFREDSILLEIFREDVVRDYKDEAVCKSSFELVTQQKRNVLFADLVKFAGEIYRVEDELITKSLESEKPNFQKDFIKRLKLSEDICQGLNHTFEHSKNVDGIDEIKSSLKNLINDIERRQIELSSY